MKIKENKAAIALSALLLLGSSLAHATPTVAGNPVETLWQWLFPAAKQPGPSLGCESFPVCEPPQATKPAPAASAKQK